MDPLSSPVSRRDRIAELVSKVFHPLIIVIPTLIIAMLQTGSTLPQALLWTLLAACIVNVPMALLIFSGVRSGRYTDMSVSIREQRRSIYLVGAATLIVLLVVLILGNAPQVLIACLISAVIATFLGYWINRYTKLSIQSAAMAGCVTVLLWTTPVVGIVLALFTPLVGWARIRLKHHTVLQILIGWMVALVCVMVVFAVML
jgi:hypothetical protein